MPLIYSLSGFEVIKVNFETIVPVFFIIISILLISKVPTYSLKKIIVPRSLTIFLLFSIVLFFGLLLVYTFKVMIITGMLYLLCVPISLAHYLKLNKKNLINDIPEDNHEDML